MSCARTFLKKLGGKASRLKFIVRGIIATLLLNKHGGVPTCIFEKEILMACNIVNSVNEKGRKPIAFISAKEFRGSLCWGVCQPINLF